MRKSKVIRPPSRDYDEVPISVSIIPPLVYIDDSYDDTPRSIDNLPPLVPASEYLNLVGNRQYAGTALHVLHENERMIESLMGKMDLLNRMNIDLRKNIVQLKLLNERSLRYAPLVDSDDEDDGSDIQLIRRDGEYKITRGVRSR